MSRKKVVHTRPQWLVDFRKRTRIIDVIDLAFDHDCECVVCKEIRALAEELGELFVPPGMPTRRRR